MEKSKEKEKESKNIVFAICNLQIVFPSNILQSAVRQRKNRETVPCRRFWEIAPGTRFATISWLFFIALEIKQS